MTTLNDHERRVAQQAAAREARRMAEKEARLAPFRLARVLRDLDNVSPGAAVDLQRVAEDSIFQKPPGLSEMQKQAIERDSQLIEDAKAGKGQPAASQLELRRAQAAKSWFEQRSAENQPNGTRHWPRVKGPFERFGS